MEIELNGRKDLLKGPPDANLRDVLTQLRASLANKGLIVAELTLDGELLTEDREQELAEQSVEDFRLLQIGAIRAGELVERVLAGLQNVIDPLIQKSRAIGELVQAGDRMEALGHLTKLVTDLASFTEGVNHSFRFLRSQGTDVSSPIEGNLEAMRALLERLSDCLQSQEDVEFADLLSHEVPENLETWRELLGQMNRTLATEEYESEGSRSGN